MLDAATFDSDRTPLADGVELRRARISMGARFFRDLRLRADVELATETPELRAAWVGYSGIPRTTLRLGQQLEPFGLEELTSSNDITFLERGLPGAFASRYRLGLLARSHGDHWSAAAGSFRGSLLENTPDDWSSAARITWAPVARERAAFHLAASLGDRVPDAGRVRFRARPESRVTDERLISTGRLSGIRRQRRSGLETALVLGAASVQAEWVGARLSRDGGRAGVGFSGWYVAASLFVTGEARNYRAGSGTFGRVEPQHVFGAVELAWRSSALDLDDLDVAGGSMEIESIGMNWYASSYLRLMVDASRVRSQAGGLRDGPRILAARLQIAIRP